MNTGGPVWHASARSDEIAVAWELAERMLHGVGDKVRGEWPERGHEGVVHIRRRLSDQEARKFNVRVRDIRGTAEEKLRLHILLTSAPHLRRALWTG